MARTLRFVGSPGVGVTFERSPERYSAVTPRASLELPIFDQHQAAVARLEGLLRQAQAREAALAVDIRSEVRVARIMLHEWSIAPGTSRPNPAVRTDFNTFTFNGRAWPGTALLVVKKGDRVRVRLGNLSMDSHPIHLHGHQFEVTGTDGGTLPPSARFCEVTTDVPVGATRDIEFVADNPGDWAFHCHKSHHTMNAMSHDLPNMIGGLTSCDDPGWYKQPPGTLARKV